MAPFAGPKRRTGSVEILALLRTILLLRKLFSLLFVVNFHTRTILITQVYFCLITTFWVDFRGQKPHICFAALAWGPHTALLSAVFLLFTCWRAFGVLLLFFLLLLNWSTFSFLSFFFFTHSRFLPLSPLYCPVLYFPPSLGSSRCFTLALGTPWVKETMCMYVWICAHVSVDLLRLWLSMCMDDIFFCMCLCVNMWMCLSLFICAVLIHAIDQSRTPDSHHPWEPSGRRLTPPHPNTSWHPINLLAACIHTCVFVCPCERTRAWKTLFNVDVRD